MHQCLARLKQSFSLFPPRKRLIWAVNSLIAQSHYCISNDINVRCRSLSRKFHGEMTLFASAFAKPMKIRAGLSLFDTPIKCFVFLITFCFYIDFQSYMKVALFSEELSEIYCYVYNLFIEDSLSSRFKEGRSA